MSPKGPFKRHLNILVCQAGAILLVVALAIGGAVSGSLSHSSTQTDTTAIAAQVENRNDFYLVLAGEKDGKSNSPSDKLAGDINLLLGENPSETDLIAVTGQINAAALDYPNITEEIGFSPFTGVGSCGECGRLNDQMVTRLHTIVIEGDVDSLITQPPTVDTTKTLTLAGMPVWMEIFLLWQIGGGIGLLFGLVKYGDPKMTWAKLGPHDRTRKYGFLLAPLPMTAYHLVYNRPKLIQRQNHDMDIIENAGFGDRLRYIESRLGQLLALPSQDLADPGIAGAIEEYNSQKDIILSYPRRYESRARKDILRGLTDGDRVFIQETQDLLDARNQADEEISSW